MYTMMHNLEGFYSVFAIHYLVMLGVQPDDCFNRPFPIPDLALSDQDDVNAGIRLDGTINLNAFFGHIKNQRLQEFLRDYLKAQIIKIETEVARDQNEKNAEVLQKKIAQIKETIEIKILKRKAIIDEDEGGDLDADAAPVALTQTEIELMEKNQKIREKQIKKAFEMYEKERTSCHR